MINFTNPKSKFDLIVYDFDGVMTNNLVYLSEDGKESVACNRSDGLAVGMLRGAGFEQIIISTECNPVVLLRANKLGLKAIQGCKDKKDTLYKYCKEGGYSLDKVIYVGNDLNDKEVMSMVGYPICPQDAYSEIKNIACYITKAEGGCGVVRELAGLIVAGL